MKTNRNELLSILKKLNLVVIPSETGVKSSIYFDTNNLIATNGNMIISSPFKTDFKCFIRPDKVIKYLEKVKSEEVDINFENDTFILKDKKTKLELKTNIYENITNLKKVKNWDDVPSNFYQGLKQSLFSSTNMGFSRFSYVGYVAFIKDKIFSTTGKRLSEFVFDKEMGDFCVIQETIVTLLKITNIKQYQILDGMIVFKTKDNLTIYCEYKNLDLPKYETILDIPKDSIQIDFLDCFIEGVDFCDLLNQDLQIEDKRILFNINKDILNISTESIQGKITYEYKLDKTYDKNINFYLNPNLIKEILNQKDFKCYYDFEEKIYFINDNYKFVCMICK